MFVLLHLLSSGHRGSTYQCELLHGIPAQLRKAPGDEQRPLVEGQLRVLPRLEGTHVAVRPGLGCAERSAIDVGGIFAADLGIAALGDDLPVGALLVAGE